MSRELGADNDAALARLKKALIAQPGFQLVLLEVPEGPLRARVLEQVLAWSSVDGVPRLQHLRARGRAEVVPKLKSKHGGIILEDIDSALLDDESVDRLVGALNWQRDQLRKRIAGPLILVVSARGVARLFERAPDLTSWRAHTCRLTVFGRQPSLDTAMKGLLAEVKPDPIDLERLGALLTVLKLEKLPPEFLAQTWIRAGLAYQRCGDQVQARRAFDNAAEISPGGHTYLWAKIRLAALDVLEGKLVKARESIQGLEPQIAEGKDSELQLVWIALKGDLAEASTSPAESIALRSAAVELAASSGDAGLEDAMRLVLAGTLHRRGLSDKAMALLTSLRERGEVATRVKSYELSAQIEQERDRPDLAIALLREGLLLASTDSALRRVELTMAMKLALLLLSLEQQEEAWKVVSGDHYTGEALDTAIRAAATLGKGLVAIGAEKRTAVSILESAAKLVRGRPHEAFAQFLLAIARAGEEDVEGSRHAAQSAMRLARSEGNEQLQRIIQPVYDALFDYEEAAPNLVGKHLSRAKRKRKKATLRVSSAVTAKGISTRRGSAQ